MNRLLKAVLLGWMVTVASGAFAQERPFKVIGNPATTPDSVSKRDLERVFLKRTKKWPGGQTVVPVDQAQNTDLRARFSEDILGKSMDGYESLLIDIYETQDLVGFRHYITDGMVAVPNTFVRDHTDLADRTPPAWSSTYNPHIFPFPTPPLQPDPRVGIQELVVG